MRHIETFTSIAALADAPALTTGAVRRYLATGCCGAAFATTLLASGGVYADGTPTTQDLLRDCNNKTDSCTFTPTRHWTDIGNLHQVGDAAYNCTQADQQVTINWSETTGTSTTAGVSVTAEAGFWKIVSVAVTASYSKTWEASSTFGQAPTQTVNPGNVGWVVRGTAMQHVIGDYELHYGHRVWGHFIWYVKGVQFDGPIPGADGQGKLVFEQAPMTAAERAKYCNAARPPAGVRLARAGGNSPRGSVVRAKVKLDPRRGRGRVLSPGRVSGQPGRAAIRVQFSDAGGAAKRAAPRNKRR